MAIAAALVASTALTHRISVLAQGLRTVEQVGKRIVLNPSDVMQPFLKDLEPGGDGFMDEKIASELAARLEQLSTNVLAAPVAIASPSPSLFAPDFRGGPLLGAGAAIASNDAFSVARVTTPPAAPALEVGAFRAELLKLVDGMRRASVAEFLVTAIQTDPATRLVHTDVRYDIVGSGPGAWRLEHVGIWQLTWRRDSDRWNVVEWVSRSDVGSRAVTPVFTEITRQALAGNEDVIQQFGVDLDTWMARLDSVLTRDSNGHHGVSVGDADGDGLEDLYVAQPAGLPNRLLRARGDGTFEDVTERSGLGVLDDTAESLFVDVDNDGDEDVVLATGTSPMLFINDGTGRFTPAADAFHFKGPMQGVLTSISMADYDRDGYVDVYLCVYSYFFGAGEDKAGTPMPYYDARNGPPGVLFRNDGHGHFVDVTSESGLDAGNDRYHFAAAWADYDGDGWPDLLVANDFGTKNLYRSRGVKDGKVTFVDVAAEAGVLDHGAGMSAAFVDYDNDGLLDIYTGNMWSASGLRVTGSAAFMPDAPAGVRALYQRHARGNSLFRNRGDGHFEDATLGAHAEMGRWAWSSDALDFDSDGWEDLYVVNGMLSRVRGERDLDGFFWRQVVARSPLTRVKGTPYDDAWRTINQLLMHDSIASHQRNVFLRNDGHGGFDDVSGAVGLDLDQDGRSFAVLDIDHDGDSDLVIMAARQAPQLRVFRNDYTARGAALAVRLVGRESNRDAIGARVVLDTERFRRTKIVQAGSGFLSQHSKELLFGLGQSQRIVKLTVTWPSGRTQEFADVALNGRVRLVEGGGLEREAFGPSASLSTSLTAPRVGPRTWSDTWLYEPFPAPDFSLPDLQGVTRSLAALKGHPSLLLFWRPGESTFQSPLTSLAEGKQSLERSGIGVLVVALEPPGASNTGWPTAAWPPVVVATREVAVSYAILNRQLHMNKPDLYAPTTMLLDATGNVVKVYRERLDPARLLEDATGIQAADADRLARALPFAGTFYSPLPRRNYLAYGRELLDQGIEAPALEAFERAAQASPSASTLYRLGTLLAKTGATDRAQATFERALALQPDLAEASNDLGALLARGGQLDAAIARFRAALAATPDYPDALNNLGYALLLDGKDDEAKAMYQKALALQPDFPEALNNLGLLLGRHDDMEGAERYFRDALARRADYGEAVNNLALVLVARGQTEAAVPLLSAFLEKNPGYDGTYITLAKIYLSTDRQKDGLAVLERLLQRQPTNTQARELIQQFK